MSDFYVSGALEFETPSGSSFQADPPALFERPDDHPRFIRPTAKYLLEKLDPFNVIVHPTDRYLFTKTLSASPVYQRGKNASG